MPIDTEIKGSPGSVEGASDWLRSTLGKAVTSSADALAAARSTAGSDWQGETGSTFASTMGTAVGRADALASAASGVAGALDAFAARLSSLQNRMADIRGTAQGAGLTVSAYLIEDPGAGPANPGPPPSGPISPDAAHAYDAAVDAWNAHQDKVRAYNKAAEDAADVRSDLATATQGLQDEYRGLEGPDWVLNASDIAGGFAGAVMEYNASALRGTSKYFGDLASRYVEHIKATPGSFSNADLNYWDDVARNADDVAGAADDLERASKGIPLKVGGALAIAGIGLDIASGEDPVQATASGAGGFLASVGAGAATGAVVGSFVPIPGFGTAAGAVVGAGVGIFTSGAIDSLFENGPDVGAAVDSGLDALEDTAGAIADGAGAVVDGIGGLFD
ncbi:hypothetical protein [Nocardioides aquiterrae]|uniref:WXG100 family type VII secretion target n=1 Tax=Nocardioides aquiterrae TaxID=203799 RepID=A0ABN1URH5_9ACTN